MSLFGRLFKGGNDAEAENKTTPEVGDNTSVGFPILSVHDDIQNLLWIEDGPYKNWKESRTETIIEVTGIKIRMVFGVVEPSLISLNYPISNEKLGQVDAPGYYPSYKEFTPQQRGVYWSFLRNPYAGNYDISYVFVLYYGLERHLYQGNFDKAAEVIIKLRKIYDNKSFQMYSANALILTSLARRRPDVIAKMFADRREDYDDKMSPDLLFLCKLGLDEEVTIQDLLTFFRAFGFTNTRYLKDYPKIFREALEKHMGGQPLYVADYVTQDDLKNADRVLVNVYANYSFEERTTEIPKVLSCPTFHDKIYGLLQAAHNDVKDYLKEQRNNGIKVDTPKKKEKELPEFNQDREWELLDALKSAKTAMEKHFAYISIYEFYYYYRDLSDDYVQLSKQYALEDLDNMPSVQKEYKAESQVKANQYAGTSLESSFVSEQEKGFAANIPAYQRLYMIYDREHNYQAAIDICEKAIGYYSSIGDDADVEAFNKKKAKAEKKLNVADQKNR